MRQLENIVGGPKEFASCFFCHFTHAQSEIMVVIAEDFGRF